MANEYDFQIDDLKFRAAISDDFPYQRTTAPFRKDQFDTSPTVGDQSLSGWWTRGQLSFHMGEGVKYYEVLDGESVLNRFRTGEHVDPTDPGAVTLGRAPQDKWTLDPGGATVDGATFEPTVGAGWVIGSSPRRLYIGLDAGGSGSACSNSLGVVTPYLTAGSGYIYNATDGSNGIVRYAGGGAGQSLYTTTGQISGLWYGKDRLWFSDLSGDIYAISPNPTGPLPVAVGSSDLVFSVPAASSSANRWAFAAGNSAVYFGLNNVVYAVRPDTSGAIPALTSGVTVLSLADNETIKSICSILGYLVVCTSSGIRVAVEQSDGSLVCGPLIVRGEGVCRQMGTYGSYVYALLKDVEDRAPGTRLVRVYLDRTVSSFAPAYDSTAVDLTNAAYQGVASAPDGAAVYGGTSTGRCLQVWDSPTAPLSMTGTLTTGFHRLGTLEPKAFQYLRVKTSGADGSVSVTLILPDGSEVSAGSVVAGGARDIFIGRLLPGPVEYLGVRFTLTGSGAAGPILLGYQLKALPVPERQRLLKWPLALTDEVRSRYGKALGRKGKGWDDVQALEALESSSAVVTFTDHRTGETGSAYIDSVEFVSNTPSLHNDNGFGGIAYLTLRVID